jgi:hypothetical protein
MLDFPLLETFVHASLNLLSEGIHLISLLLYQSCLRCNDLLVSLLHVSISLLFLHLLGFYLDLMCLGILLLAGELALNRLQVQ